MQVFQRYLSGSAWLARLDILTLHALPYCLVKLLGLDNDGLDIGGELFRDLLWYSICRHGSMSLAATSAKVALFLKGMPERGLSMGAFGVSQNEQGLVELTPRQRAAANARAHRRPGFTPEGLERLRAAALEQKPWLSSTGPRTDTGKLRSRMNAYKGGFKSRLRSFQAFRRDLSTWLSSLDTEAARGNIAAAIRGLRWHSVELDAALFGCPQYPVRQEPDLGQDSRAEGEEA